MVGKRCPAPRNGGSSRNAIFYVLAEELTSKVTHERVNEPIQEGQRAELSALMAESLERRDRGVGVVWSPSTAADGRPSSIYARGVMSLYTADVEIQSLFDAQSRVKSPVAHFVFSLSSAESATVSDEQLIRASMATLDGAGWSGHAAVATVHQDTMRYVDGKLVDGNKHCHVAIASINSRTLRAYDRTQEYMRLHRSLREQEIAFGMDEDWGLYKVADRGLSSERVVRTNAVDWEARKQEQSMERAERLARHFVSDHSLESVRDREDRIVHALRFRVIGSRRWDRRRPQARRCRLRRSRREAVAKRYPCDRGAAHGRHRGRRRRQADRAAHGARGKRQRAIGLDG